MYNSLPQAKLIVNREKLPKGRSPKGSYYNTTDIKHQELGAEEVVRRDNVLEASMPFIFTLIFEKLKHSSILRKNARESKPTSSHMGGQHSDTQAPLHKDNDYKSNASEESEGDDENEEAEESDVEEDGDNDQEPNLPEFDDDLLPEHVPFHKSSNCEENENHRAQSVSSWSSWSSMKSS